MKTATSSPRPTTRRKVTSPRLRIRNLLVPTDFSKASLHAIAAAIPILKKFGARLHVVHVFEPDPATSTIFAMQLTVPDSQVGRRVRSHLKAVAKKHAITLPEKNIHAIKGRPFEEICRLAAKAEIDLIVTATRGNTGFKHLMLGSTTERIVQHSPCPVLVVRGRQAGDDNKPVLDIQKILVPMDFSECSMKGLAYAKELEGIQSEAGPPAFGGAAVLRHE